jgi:ribosome-binding protein aMBF1 (putative translation factor)
VEAYARLIEAQGRIANARERHGVSYRRVADALDAGEPDAPELESGRSLYRSTLTRYVEALGGELRQEVALFAVFPGQRVELPPPPGG